MPPKKEVIEATKEIRLTLEDTVRTLRNHFLGVLGKKKFTFVCMSQLVRILKRTDILGQ